MDKSEFNVLNHTVYGNISGQILNGDYRMVLGYSYETEYHPSERFGGVMFMTTKEPKWSEVRHEVIDKLRKDLGL